MVPDGTLWGANAFNGIINIITRNARDTQGALGAFSIGNEEKYTAAARYGWQPTDRQAARIYVKAYERDTGFDAQVAPYDAARMRRGGFRWDWNDRARNKLTLSGDLFDADTGIRENPTFVQDVVHRGRNVLGRWNHELSTDNSVQAQLYYDHVDYESFGFTQHRDTYDLELQQSVRAGSRHFLVWGAGQREMRDDTHSGLSGLVDVLPLRRADEITTVFAQDTIALAPDRVNLTLGLKYERTDYAPSEWLPNVRIAYTPSSEQTWWASVGEATRVPSRIESDLTFFNVIRLGTQYGAEHVRAYEVGHRWLLSPRVWYDVAAFYNDYDDLRSGEAGGPLRNFMHGHSSGIEVAFRWEPTENWRIDTAYTYLVMSLGLDAASTSNPGQLAYIEGLAARNQVSVRSAIDLTRGLQIDSSVRYVGRLGEPELPRLHGTRCRFDLGLAVAGRAVRRRAEPPAGPSSRAGFRFLQQHGHAGAAGRVRESDMAILKVAHAPVRAVLLRLPLLLLASMAMAAPGEYQVKAVFLFNFTQFVDWPPAVLRERPVAVRDRRARARPLRQCAG